ncbi:MAG TPA: tetratricopeptide repeat protein [Terriglobales bacterium]|nr:tetratricopeptide repeat protein [Terriglobales bacterium]
MRLRSGGLVLIIVACLAVGSEGAGAPPVHKILPSRMPLTTSSAVARKRFEKGMQALEYLRRAEAVDDFRSAVKADPNFAQALILISHLSHDPAEQQSTLLRAKGLAPKVSSSEQTLIQWLSGVQEDNYVPAIAAMNDLLARYPQDRRLLFLAGRWLIHQERYQQGIVILERAVALDPNYPAALNELGYAYAYSGDFDKGIAAMERYVALEPDQPNPHDSYGEILRLAGHFDAALEQYRTSIRVDPNFGSELGVADTYAVMGKEPEAREEYERAIVFTNTESDRVEYELQSATTWIRDNNRKQAERALKDVGHHAHAAGLAVLEAETHRILAMYEPDYKAAIKQLQVAQAALEEAHQVSKTDRNDETARILEVRTARAADAQDFDTGAAALKQLEDMAQASRSQVVQLSYHAAAGAELLAQGKADEAIPHLQEDSSNPESMRLLWKAYSSTGATADASALAAKLASLNVPTVEQALVVPQFRASLVSQAGQP